MFFTLPIPPCVYVRVRVHLCGHQEAEVEESKEKAAAASIASKGRKKNAAAKGKAGGGKKKAKRVEEGESELSDFDGNDSEEDGERRREGGSEIRGLEGRRNEVQAQTHICYDSFDTVILKVVIAMVFYSVDRHP